MQKKWKHMARTEEHHGQPAMTCNLCSVLVQFTTVIKKNLIIQQTGQFTAMDCYNNILKQLKDPN